MADTVRTRGAYAKSAQRRHEILQAGVQVFSESGYRSGSIREIADRVGMSQAGLLHHFASKGELLEAVLTHRDDIARERMSQETGWPRGVELLEAMVELVANNQRTPGLVALYAVLSAEATSPDHPAHQYFRDRYDFVLGIIRVGLEEAGVEGRLVPGVDQLSAARQFVALMDGLQVQWLLDPDGLDMAAEVRRYVQTLVTGELQPLVRPPAES
jgi:AcrR family transcriptional regulator